MFKLTFKETALLIYIKLSGGLSIKHIEKIFNNRNYLSISALDNLQTENFITMSNDKFLCLRDGTRYVEWLLYQLIIVFSFTSIMAIY